MADLVTVATFVQRAEAMVARSLLHTEGMFALVPEEHVLSTMPHLIHAEGGYRLMVREQDADRAKHVLREAELENRAEISPQS